MLRLSAPPEMTPAWLLDLLGADAVVEGAVLEVGGRQFACRNGILRELGGPSESNAQMAEAFGFKWAQRGAYESDVALAGMRDWLLARYGDVAGAEWWAEYGAHPVLLDAGCGAALSAIELFGDRLKHVRYVGADVSGAVDVAAERFRERNLDGGFLQADLTALPLPDSSVDVIFSEGVLHYMDPPSRAVRSLRRLLKRGGRFLFYVYRKKGPVREYTDEYIRERLRELSPADAWEAVKPLTKLGKALGDLNVTVEVPEDVTLLGIPAGPIDIQRLFYWHVVKAYHRPDMTLDELNVINFDWYGPRHAYHQTPEEVRASCAETGLIIEREQVEEAGITIVARAA